MAGRAALGHQEALWRQLVADFITEYFGKMFVFLFLCYARTNVHADAKPCVVAVYEDYRNETLTEADVFVLSEYVEPKGFIM